MSVRNIPQRVSSIGGAGTKKRGFFNGYFFKDRHQIRIQILFVKYLLDSLMGENPQLQPVLMKHIKSLNKCLSNFSTLSVANKSGCLHAVLFEVIDNEEVLKPAFMAKFHYWKMLAEGSPRKWVAVPAGHYTKEIRMSLRLIDLIERIILGINNQLMNKPIQIKKGLNSSQRGPMPALGDQFQAYFDDYRTKLKAYTLYLKTHKKDIDEFFGQTFIEICAKTREEAFFSTYEKYRQSYPTISVTTEKARLKALMEKMKKDYQKIQLTEKPLKELYKICLESTKIFYALQYGYMGTSGEWKREWSVGLNAMYDVLMDKNFLLEYKEELL